MNATKAFLKSGIVAQVFFLSNSNVSYLVQETCLRQNIEMFQKSIKSEDHVRYVSRFCLIWKILIKIKQLKSSINVTLTQKLRAVVCLGNSCGYLVR